MIPTMKATRFDPIPAEVEVLAANVVDADLLVGTIGEVDPERLKRVQGKLANWIQGL